MHQLESLTIEALAELRDAVTAKLADRVAARQRELQQEADRIGGLIDGKAPKPKAAPKYQKGAESWSGRGSQPAFVRDHLMAGGTLDQLKV